MQSKQLLAVYVLLLAAFTAQAQTEDAWVFFTDKEDVQASIDNPISILTQEAIDRKALHDVAIDERDVPVNEAYITQLKSQPGITVYAKSKWMNCVYVRGSESAIADLEALGFVEDIEYADKSLNAAPIQEPVPDKFAVEVREKAAIDYGLAANQIEMLSGDFLHDQGYTGTGMRIAVLDSGFPGVDTESGFAYVRDDNRILGTYDFIARSETLNNNSTHGTRTFSTIGGYLEGQFAGTAPDASFYLFKTEDVTSETPVEEAYWVEALERADSLGVHVVNTSLGYRAYDNPNYSHTYDDLDGETTFSARGATIGFDKGMVLVTSAGNSGNSGFPWISTPGDCPDMLTVGAVAANGDYAGFSSIGPNANGIIKPDVMAQGLEPFVISENNQVVTSSGTSFSSPIMAGVVACLWEADPEKTNLEIMELVRESAHLYAAPTDEMGYGIPDFEAAYNQLLLDSPEAEFTMFKAYPNPVNDFITIETPEMHIGADLVCYSLLGKTIVQTRITENKQQLDLSALPTGIYILEFRSKTKRQHIKISKI